MGVRRGGASLRSLSEPKQAGGSGGIPVGSGLGGVGWGRCKASQEHPGVRKRIGDRRENTCCKENIEQRSPDPAAICSSCGDFSLQFHTLSAFAFILGVLVCYGEAGKEQ